MKSIKKIAVIIIGIAGFVIAWGAVSADEIMGAAIPLSHLVMQTFAGVMLMGMSFALARWE